MPEVDGRSLWEVVVRMETKLDMALTKVDDHEHRLRDAASTSDLAALRAKVELLALEQNSLANKQYVTPKGLLASSATTITVLLGLITLLNHLLK